MYVTTNRESSGRKQKWKLVGVASDVCLSIGRYSQNVFSERDTYDTSRAFYSEKVTYTT